jgi:phenylacetic acid degradation operon negative regulatory protein
VADDLAAGFVFAAGVLRHLLADPLLPASLLPADWPGDELRARYDRYELAFKALWREWFRASARESP